MYLGIDAGGTHTDAVIIRGGVVAARAKLPTQHEDLVATLGEVLAALPAELRSGTTRVTLGTTLAVNALLQDKADAVGLALCGGPGLDPARFALGEYTHVVPGGLDHQGVEVRPQQLDSLRTSAKNWQQLGVRAFAAVSKFSPRNPAFERAMAATLAPFGDIVCQGHALSGLLNFPRRIAAAYYNAAIWRLHNSFADAADAALRKAGIRAPLFFLKADGGSIPLAASRMRPVYSLISGPAASAMGLLALADNDEDAILLDIGGTTTDIALYAHGVPVLEREGMLVRGRATPVRALAASSIPVGGDSALSVTDGRAQVGPLRHGPALAFGGNVPTLLDALNVLENTPSGNARASRQGIETLAAAHGLQATELSREAVRSALAAIAKAIREQLARINGHPVYTLAALLKDRRLAPQRVFLVGGPAPLLHALLEQELGLPVLCPPHTDIANAVGAAVSLPSTALELFADTAGKRAFVPVLEKTWPVDRSYDLERAEDDARRLLRERLATESDGHSLKEQGVDVLESALFATLGAYGQGARDIRVVCQSRPGIACRVST
jgi:N-methylhydantoinase A/oxoprolinase/acetone carboxylase beta subunit